LITITDVEDKSIAEANREGISVERLTQKNMNVFLKDIELLRIKSPAYLPRSSTSVNQAAKLIEALVKKGYAYWYKHKGRRNAYYDPLKFKDFGKISNLDMSEWPEKRRRFHRDTYPGTPWNKGDFILWHGHKEGDRVYWDTEIGKGRPAWNVQDAAMVTQHLGFEIDIACGGVDNLVRHHDYNVAVAEGVSGKEFAHYWLHGEHLFVDGEKMSKSKGNIYYLRDLIRRGYKKEHIRFFLIHGYYRKRLNFTFKRLRATSQKLDRLKSMVDNLQKARPVKRSGRTEKLIGGIVAGFEGNMNNDLDVEAAFDDVFEVVSELDALREQKRLSSEERHIAIANLRRIDQVLQIIF
jgi:cysteinyl-tRNA synthetase